MVYGDFKDLARRTASDKVLRDKKYKPCKPYILNHIKYIAKNLKYDGYQRGLASMVYKSFSKKSTLLAEPTKGSSVNN